MPIDPRLDSLRDALARLDHGPAGPPPRPTAGAAEAAVALLLRADPEMHLLLIRRAEKETDPWSGHVALPGGRRDPADADLLATACRETEEEVGIDPCRDGTLLGRLAAVTPSSRRLPPLSITPWVFGLQDEPRLRLDEREVDAAVWVPLHALRDERSAGQILIEVEGASLSFPSLTWGDYVVWGLTLRILQQFFRAAERIL